MTMSAVAGYSRAVLWLLALLGALILPSQAVQAEDIDIYAGAPSDNDRPNVLIILDSSANWSAA
ncbi:MAG: hypothetical protein ACK49H_01385, partial [Burkholderiales bacterium]